MEILDQLKPIEEEDLQTAIRQLTNYSLLEERSDSYVLHGLLQKAIRHAMPESHRRDYIRQGLKALRDFSQDLDPNNPTTRKRLDPYIPHFEVIIESAKEIVPIESTEINLLLTKLFNYYQYDRKEGSYKRIAEIFLIRLQQQDTLNRRKKGDLKEDIETAEYYQQIGTLLGHLNRLEEALSAWQRSLEICRLELGEDHLTTARSYRNVGVTLDNLRRHEEALQYHQRALEIRELKLGDDHLTTANSYHEVGITLGYLGRHEEALTHHQRALQIRELNLGEDHLTTADSYREVGVTLGNSGRHDEALTYNQRALEIRKEQLGDDHLATADSYHQVGKSLNLSGRHDEAMPYLEHALKIRTKLFGENGLETAATCYRLGVTLNAMGKYEEAIAYAQRALEVNTEARGSEHPITTDSYNSVQTILRNLGRHD